MPRIRWTKWRVVGLCVLVLSLGAVAANYLLLDDWVGSATFSPPSDFDAETKSTDLEADIKLMWETAPSKGTSKVTASSDRAICAASRVFNSVNLVGKTGLEVKALLGSPTKSNESVYRGEPFWPMKERGMTYRFDCGFYGWEFHVYVNGDNERVTEVARHWIH